MSHSPSARSRSREPARYSPSRSYSRSPSQERRGRSHTPDRGDDQVTCSPHRLLVVPAPCMISQLVAPCCCQTRSTYSCNPGNSETVSRSFAFFCWGACVFRKLAICRQLHAESLTWLCGPHRSPLSMSAASHLTRMSGRCRTTFRSLATCWRQRRAADVMHDRLQAHCRSWGLMLGGLIPHRCSLPRGGMFTFAIASCCIMLHCIARCMSPSSTTCFMSLSSHIPSAEQGCLCEPFNALLAGGH